MKKTGNSLKRNIAFLFAALLHILAYFQFYLSGNGIVTGSAFQWQFPILLGFSLLISLLLRIGGGGFLILGILKIGILFFIGYPLGGYIGLELTLYLSLAIEASLYLSSTGGAVFQLAALVCLLVSQQAVSAFYLDLPAPSLHDMVSLGLYAFLGSCAALIINRLSVSRSQKDYQIQRLDAAVGQLTRANLGFQSYASHLEVDTLHSERKRISREIHDTVGYSLTNLLMMIEAASDVIEKDPSKSRLLLTGALQEARRCLNETRASMREMRSSELRQPTGLSAAARLVSSFSAATGVHLAVEYGNASRSYGEQIDTVILRMLQEGMTNAFRHGMATEIRIQFWERDEALHVRIQDNGRGAGDMGEGIGLAGMRERIEALGGEFSAGNGAGGFRLDAAIPVSAGGLSRRKSDGKNTITAG